MPEFGKESSEKLVDCHPDLANIARDVVEVMDCKVLHTYRGEIEQNRAYSTGASTKKFPHSKHNVKPSIAIDLPPWVDGQIPWNRPEYFYLLAGHFMQAAARRGIKVIWGGDWNRNGILVKYDKKEKLNDLCHFELARD